MIVTASRIPRIRGLWLIGCAAFAVAATAAEGELQDPTRPPAYRSVAVAAQQPGTQALVVSSILISPNRRVAVINGMTVGRGDRIGDARVVEIARDAVHLERGGNRFRAALLPISVKQRSNDKAAGQR